MGTNLSYAATELEIAAIAARATSLREAGPELLGTICRDFGFVLGEAWVVDEDAGVLRWAAGWHALDGRVEFSEVAKSLAVGRGYGLVGRVWASAQAEWVTDVLADEAFPRASQARKAGLRAGFGLPLLCGERASGVMLFFGHQIREADRGIMAAAHALGAAMGRLALASTLEGRSEGFFQSLVENLGDVVFVVDLRGLVVYASPRTQEVGGVPPTERTGKGPLDFIHQDDLPRVFSALRDVVQSPRGEARVEYRVRHKDGSWHLFESIGRLLAKGGAAPVVVVSARDITKRATPAPGKLYQALTIADRDDDRIERVGLSPHQTRLLSLVAEGLTNRQIGEALGLSPNTVKDHMRSIFKRLGAKNRTEAALAAARMGLLP